MTLSDAGRVSRAQLEALLSRCGADELFAAFQSEWLNDVFPGISLLSGCEQSLANHSEGDVAVHTAMVFDRLLETCRADLGRDADFVERVAAVMHDWKKPDARTLHPDGSITFPGHEELAAAEVPEVARKLCLTDEETSKLLFLVAEHGNAHSFPELPSAKQEELRASRYFESLCAFQKADALSCRLVGGGHLPVHWSQMALPQGASYGEEEG